MWYDMGVWVKWVEFKGWSKLDGSDWGEAPTFVILSWNFINENPELIITKAINLL